MIMNILQITAIQSVMIYKSLHTENQRILFHQILNIIDTFDTFVKDYNDREWSNNDINWNQSLNNSFYHILISNFEVSIYFYLFIINIHFLFQTG